MEIATISLESSAVHDSGLWSACAFILFLVSSSWSSREREAGRFRVLILRGSGSVEFVGKDDSPSMVVGSKRFQR